MKSVPYHCRYPDSVPIVPDASKNQHCVDADSNAKRSLQELIQTIPMRLRNRIAKMPIPGRLESKKKNLPGNTTSSVLLDV
jgi:hypothetical protein